MPLIIKFFYTCFGGWELMTENNRPIAYIIKDLLFSQTVEEGTLSSSHHPFFHLSSVPTPPIKRSLSGEF